MALASTHAMPPVPAALARHAPPTAPNPASAGEDDEDDEEELVPRTPPAAPTSPAPSAAPRTVPWASAASLSSGEVNEDELAPPTPLAATLGPETGAVRVASDVGSPSAGGTAVVARSVSACPGGLPGRTAEECCEVMEERRSGHARRQPVSARSLAFKRWAHGRCFRCLARGHIVRDCREPFRCIGCLRPGHRERDCWRHPPDAPSCDRRDPCSPPLARSWAEVVASSPMEGARSAPQQRREVHYVSHHVEGRHDTCDIRGAAVVDPGGTDKGVLDQSIQAAFATQLALFRSQIQIMVAEAIRPLREEASSSSCSVCLDHVAGLAPAPCADSVDEEKANMYGSFSPRARLCTSALPASSMSEASEVVAPVLRTMPELQELCRESPVVIPIEMGCLEALAVATTLSPTPSEHCQTPVTVDTGGLDASATLSSVAVGHVVPLGDKVDEAGVLAPNSEALFAKELSDLLVSLEAAIPGYGKDIASVLAGTASEGIIRKVEKSLRSKRKKRIYTWRFSAAT